MWTLINTTNYIYTYITKRENHKYREQLGVTSGKKEWGWCNKGVGNLQVPTIRYKTNYKDILYKEYSQYFISINGV